MSIYLWIIPMSIYLWIIPASICLWIIPTSIYFSGCLQWGNWWDGDCARHWVLFTLWTSPRPLPWEGEHWLPAHAEGARTEQTGKVTNYRGGFHHSSMDSSAPTILLPWVWVPSWPSMLLSFIVKFVLYSACVKNKNTQNRPCLAHF